MSTTAAPSPVEQKQTPADRDERVGEHARLAAVLRRPEVGAAVAALLVFVYFAFTTTAFALPAGASTWIFTSSSFAIMAVVVALLMIGGEFDLSAGAMTGTTGLITGIMMSHWHVNVWLAVITSLVVALFIGFLNGVLVMKTGLPSFIVTLGTFFVLRGMNLAVVKQIINQVSVVDFQSAPGYAAGNKLFGSYIKVDLGWLPWVHIPATGFLRIYAATWWAIGVIILATWILQRTRAGNWIFAVGGAQTSARQVGVPVFRTKVGLFMTTAFGAWIVGMLSLFKTTTAQSTTGVGSRVHLHHLCGRRRLPADRWLRLGGRRGSRRSHLRDGRPGHRVRRVGQRLAVLHPRRDAPRRRPGQQLRQVASGESAMTTEKTEPETLEGGQAPEIVGGPALPPPGTAIIEVTDIGKSYGSVIALRDVTTTVKAGEVTCVLGDNGAGKSTFIKILAGAHAHSSGDFLVDGEKRTFSSPREALALGIATVYQDLAVVPLMPVWRNFFLGSELTKGKGPIRRLDIAAMKKITKTELAAMGIDLRDVEQPIGTLSGGERQCVAIARAVYFGARVLILDEPTAALGVRQSGVVLKYVAKARDRGLGVVFISHNPHHAYPVGDRFMLLRRGRSMGNFPKAEMTLEELVQMMAGGAELEALSHELARQMPDSEVSKTMESEVAETLRIAPEAAADEATPESTRP